MKSLANLNLSSGSQVILYANDILLSRALISSSDNTKLQQDVDLISPWIECSGLAINPAKCTLLVISRKRVKPSLSIQINHVIIPTSETVKYLGVNISSDLKWNTHITNTCNSAKRKLGLLYRHFYQADQRTLSLLYKALVLPKLDYCSSVWDPHTITLSDRLESVQRFAAKLCTKRWSASSSDLFSSLNWPQLHTCRLRQKALLCRRIIRNESIIQPLSYFHPQCNPNPRTCHSCPVMLVPPPSNPPFSYLPVVYGMAFLTLWSP